MGETLALARVCAAVLDWLTLRVDATALSMAAMERFRAEQSRIMKVSGNGGIEWETAAWECIRSDSHQLTIRYTGSRLYIQGSPARIQSIDNVFGTGPVAVDDVEGSGRLMVSFVADVREVELPDVRAWRLRRLDITRNLDLGDLAAVRVAQSYLRGTEGGRYRADCKTGDTNYWAVRSRYRSAKSYAKGPHLEYQNRRNRLAVEPWKVELSQRLLRTELSLKGKFWSEKWERPWWEFSAADCEAHWNGFFGKMLGKVEAVDNVERRCIEAAPTEGQGKAAYLTWLAIRELGWERVKSNMAKATYYRHIRILRDAGLGDADISKGQVVPIRQKMISARVINSWDELRKRREGCK